ncbi:Aspartic protease, partial [Phytophthora megakarya]
EVVWAGRGDRWVTQVIYAAKSWTVAVKVVNISQSRLWLSTGTLIYQNTKSIERQRYERKLAKLEESLRPPCVRAPEYPWPSKLLLRPEPGATTARVACLQVKSDRLETGKRTGKMTSDAGTQTCETCDVSTQTDSGWESECVNILYASRDSSWMEHEAEPEPERSADPVEVSGRSNATDVETLPGSPSQTDERTPIQKLEAEYIRVMKATQEELDLEPGVYIHEGSELMSQLRDDLMMLLDLSDLTPECDISKADVGVPGRTTPAEEAQLRDVLRRHSKIS